MKLVRPPEVNVGMHPSRPPQADFAGLTGEFMAGSGMKKTKSARYDHQPLLAAGQHWRMADANLVVGMVGKLLVHYKLGKPGAVRVPNSVNGIKTIEKYLKAKKAVLAQVAPVS